MARIITKKSQIPEYIRPKIKNFSKLTDNQAIYQYEYYKLLRRASKYGQKGIEFAKSFEKAPERIYQKTIQKLRSFTKTKLKEQVEQIYIPSEPEEDIEFVTDIASEEYLADEFIQRVLEEIEASKSEAIISSSSYRSGRTKTSASRKWSSDNITRGVDLLINLIKNRTVTREEKINFYKSLKLAELQDAISEYIAGLYRVTVDELTGYMQTSRVYYLLSNAPVSMQEAKGFDRS